MLPRLLLALLLACEPVPSDLEPPAEPAALTLAAADVLCDATALLTGTAPALAGTTATATVVIDALPSTFAVDVDADGIFAIPRGALTVPVEVACPPGPCEVAFLVEVEAVVDGTLTAARAEHTATFDDDRTLRFPDRDGDGYGALDPVPACPDTDGFLDTGDDCDDTTVLAHPGQERIHCDGLDNDCLDGEEHVKTLAQIAEGATPAEQLHWALDRVDDGGQVILCDLEPFVGSFQVDGRVRAMGPLVGKAVLVPEGGPAVTVTDGLIALSDLRFEGGDPTGCLRIETSSVDLLRSSFEGCSAEHGGAIDVDPASELDWSGGTCLGNTASGDGGCLRARGLVDLHGVDLLGNQAGRGGAAMVEGTLRFGLGSCSAHTADLGGCLAIGPAGHVELGDPTTDPIVLSGDNQATTQGNQVWTQGTLQVLNAEIEATDGPAPDDVAVDGGTICFDGDLSCG
jgi:hypothetical protein